MKSLRKNKITTELSLIVSIFVFLTIYFVTHQNLLCEGTPKESLDCFVRYYTAMTESHGVSFALSDLEKRSDKIGIDCHQVAHVIGRAAIMRYDTVGEAFKNGSNICMSGFYHGVMEGIFSKYGETYLNRESINNICRDFRDQGEETLGFVNCTHGMGHGILDVTHDDLFRSLDICGLLSVSAERERCYGGVFMENIITDGKNHISKYLKDDDIFYPCTAVREEYKNACYLYQPLYILRTSNFHDTFAVCSRADTDEHKKECYQGIGMQTNSSEVSLARKNLFFCLKGETAAMQSSCISGAASSYFLLHSEDNTEIYCVNLPESLRGVCSKEKARIRSRS
jgi:hypothetical protein